MSDTAPPPPSVPPPYPTGPPPPRPSRTLYFAYGADMHMAHMARTCPSSRYIGRGVLTDYKWHINGLGFANLVKVKTAHAPGLVFEVDDDDKNKLEMNRFPLYNSVRVDCELYPAPFCLYRRQATWIVKNRGPEAVLEDAYATGRGNDRRASYTERGLLVFLNTDVTTDGRPDARYAEAINAAAADAMALGVDAVFFEKIVQQFMPGRLLPHLRVVRRPKSTSPSPGSSEERETSPGGSGGGGGSRGPLKLRKRPIPAVVVSSEGGSSIAPTPSTEIVPPVRPKRPQPELDLPSSSASINFQALVEKELLRAQQFRDEFDTSKDDLVAMEKMHERLQPERKPKEESKPREKEKEKSSGFGDTFRSMFQRGRRKESAESAESITAGGRRSPLLGGSESGNESSNGEGQSLYRRRDRKDKDEPQALSAWARAASAAMAGGGGGGGGSSSGGGSGSGGASGSGSAYATQLNRRHSKSQSESNLVEPRPLAPTITISRPSSALAKEKAATDGSESDDSDSLSRPSRTSTTPVTRPPPRPPRIPTGGPVIVPPPFARPAAPSPLSSTTKRKLMKGFVSVKTAGESTRQVDARNVTPSTAADISDSSPSLTPTVRRDTSGWDRTGNGESSGQSEQDSSEEEETATQNVGRVTERKPVIRKRVTLEQAARALEMGSEESGRDEETKSTPKRAPPKPSRPAPVTVPAPKVVRSAPVVPAAAVARPVARPVPRQPFVLRSRQRRQPTAHTAKELARRKSFCDSGRQISRFDRFLQQAAEHPHFCEKPWLPAFRGRAAGGYVYQHTTYSHSRHHVVFVHATVSVQRSRRMSF
ncbi:hypothetical protein SEUCBS140593_005540 [Sporothrix eucalyptigena]|uniref:Gamma-glutamylcyclotransferase n=1 Tax=Sporothrix eucalyptigena TaxID=1812306 RepID=A0ABP0BX42_9PEZI